MSVRKVPGHPEERQWVPDSAQLMALLRHSVSLAVFFGRCCSATVVFPLPQIQEASCLLSSYMFPWNLSLCQSPNTCVKIMSGPWHQLRVQFGKNLQALQEESAGQSFLQLNPCEWARSQTRVPAGWVESSEGTQSRRKGVILAFAYLVSETGPLYLQNQVKLHMSNLTGDTFIWEKGERKIFFNFSLQSFLGNCPTVGAPDIDKWHLWLNFWVNRDIYEGLLFFLLVDVIRLQPELA